MVFQAHTLTGISQEDLDTEIKYTIASARADEAELVCFSVDTMYSSVVARILRGIKKTKSLQFFINENDLSRGGTEVAFLINKYSDYIVEKKDAEIRFYVKI